MPSPPRPPRATAARKSAASKPALSRERVIEAALAEIDERGVAAFNLRNLAERLAVYPTAVYWHVPNKTAILAEVVAVVFRDVAPQQRKNDDWRSYLRRLFQRYRESARRHPNVAPLVAAHLVGNLRIDFDFVEGVLAALSAAGLAGARLVAGYNAVVAALIGFVIQEFSPLPEADTEQWQSAVQQRLLGVDPAAHPVLAANLPLLANKAFILRWQNGSEAPLDDSYASFVEQVLAGLESLRE
ncbi:TetR family transcriptional regulator [Tahibacter aquaticus]|uniref:TetR family transcriptional regulator n=1 Tax=Tahibacter aquaticus TaxID=520092 RepID=A0A4R6Z0F7_9GAMM|nr:TetR/AcrR family transcriptional regulator C-terminal domain-containing protein [Tahibacter aquaticus]TDR44997.1 TetR family transcriptional regulator [Tahibacter aquaticus]